MTNYLALNMIFKPIEVSEQCWLFLSFVRCHDVFPQQYTQLVPVLVLVLVLALVLLLF